jgi:hypothetical protein
MAILADATLKGIPFRDVYIKITLVAANKQNDYWLIVFMVYKSKEDSDADTEQTKYIDLFRKFIPNTMSTNIYEEAYMGLINGTLITNPIMYDGEGRQIDPNFIRNYSPILTNIRSV